MRRLGQETRDWADVGILFRHPIELDVGFFQLGLQLLHLSPAEKDIFEAESKTS